MRKILFLAASAFVPVLASTAVLADTNASSLDLSIDMQNSTSSTGDSTTVVNSTSQQTSVSTTIQNFAFSPNTMTVPQGTTVTWTNRDNTAHTVTGDTGNGPASSLIQPGQSYSFTFSSPGTYKYHCSIHPEMTATITVTASSSGGSPTQPSSSDTSSASSNSSTSAPSGNPTGTGASTSPTPNATPVASSNANTLPSTGPADIAALFIVPMLLASGLYYLRLLQHKQRSA